MGVSAVLLQPLAAASQGQWVPGIGDPSLMGWVTVFAYFTTAATSLLCSFLLTKDSQRSQRAKIRFFWLIITGILICLGINKQLDLQSWLTFFGRDVSRTWGWYAHRRFAQKLFIFALAGVGGVLVYSFASRFRELWKANLLACLGLSFLSLFVLLRASSFHHMDTLINVDLFGLRMNWILELGGISCIIVACCLNLVNVVFERLK